MKEIKLTVPHGYEIDSLDEVNNIVKLKKKESGLFVTNSIITELTNYKLRLGIKFKNNQQILTSGITNYIVCNTPILCNTVNVKLVKCDKNDLVFGDIFYITNYKVKNSCEIPNDPERYYIKLNSQYCKIYGNDVHCLMFSDLFASFYYYKIVKF
jgi:hypothetical protein